MSDITWSLAADLQALNVPGRFFAPPLAGFFPDGTSQDPFAFPDPATLPSSTVYSFEDHYEDDTANNRTTDVTLRILVTPPPGSAFPVDPKPDVPPPAIRLHAVADGVLRFNPGAAQLILATNAFAIDTAPRVPWFQRWVDAHCVPELISYENVDVVQLESYLRNIPVGGKYGISFPESKTAPIVDTASRDTFVTAFLAGNGVLSVDPSAVIGQLAPTSAGSSSYRLDMRVRYAVPKGAPPAPMNPRELLYLMFGDSSVMASSHPLLQALNTLPVGVAKSTRTMVLRSPLRTWGRLKWEAKLEADADQAIPLAANRHWSKVGKLASDTRFDKKFRRALEGVSQGVSYDNLGGRPKCNVFVSDISVRADFRVMIQEYRDNSHWVYPVANSITHTAVLALKGKATMPADAFPIMGDNPDASRLWGYAWTKYLYDGAKDAAAINKAMTKEGRAFIVSGTRPLKDGHSEAGHVVLLLEVDDTKPWPDLVQNLDTDAQTLEGYPVMIMRIDTKSSAQAKSKDDDAGAIIRNWPMICGGKAEDAGASNGFIRLHLLEASPGGDPDLLHGLYDLHVRRRPPSQFSTALDRKGIVSGG